MLPSLFPDVRFRSTAAIDRFGQYRVQDVLMFAASGALVFRWGLIGLGFAGALVSGINFIAEVFPRERRALINGAFVAFRSAGAIVATVTILADARAERRPSKDMRWHICIGVDDTETSFVRCIFKPSGS